MRVNQDQHPEKGRYFIVEVNGREQRNGWSYDSSTNSIVFEEGEEPGEGDTVTIRRAIPTSR